jgi:DHA1 family multidrug resistance protein-like MFS transporter
MWSVVQYRQIGKNVSDLHARKSRKVPHKEAPDVEKAQALPPQHGGGNVKPNEDSTASSQSEGGATGNEDKIWVEEEGDEDPLNPMNWPLVSRAKNIMILSLLIFVQAWSGAAESMANSAASKEFGVSPVAENLSTAMYLLGISSGALFAGPISETVGRNPTYLVATFCYLFFVLGSALTPTFGGQVVCRYLVGLSSSATLSINGASVRDQFRPVKRSFVFPVIAWANVAGNVAQSCPSPCSSGKLTRST